MTLGSWGDVLYSLQQIYNDLIAYGALVTSKYGTRNRAKVKTDEQESVIVKLLADARNLDNSQIAELYNFLCANLGWESITPRLVQFYRERHDLTTAAGRLGATRFRNQREMQVKRSRPTMPLLYWTLDGWTAELLYQRETTKEGRRVVTYHNRLTMVVVLDPCCNYPVGYAIGDHETPELIKEALRDAANHTALLLGRRYRTNQIQSDRYALTERNNQLVEMYLGEQQLRMQAEEKNRTLEAERDDLARKVSELSRKVDKLERTIKKFAGDEKEAVSDN